MGAPKVFISYAHDTEEFADKVLEFSNKLRENMIDANIDQYEESPSEGWPRWMENQIDNSDYVLIVCTQLYFDKVKNFNSGEGKGVNWELNIIYQHLYESCCNNTKFIPIIFNEYKTNNILKPLQSSTYYFVDREREFKKLCNRLKGINNITKPPLGTTEEKKVLENKIEVKERKNLFVTSMIDINTWDKAKWNGIAYLFYKDNEDPPIMALTFRNKDYGKKIFKDWKKSCKDDIFDDIEISVIEKKNVGKCDGYFVYITSNIDACMKRAEKQGCSIDETLFTFISRYQYMDINMYNNNLSIFKKQMEFSNNKFCIAPAIFKNGEIDFDTNNIEIEYSLCIKMNKIKFLKYEDITENDIEYAVVKFPNVDLEDDN